KRADWILDIGPEGGPDGGELIAQGTPEQVRTVKGSHTGRYLKPLLKKPRKVAKTRPSASKARSRRS
ncbi:MAG: hypothetical protein ACKVK6_08920, partial [bacterium]